MFLTSIVDEHMFIKCRVFTMYHSNFGTVCWWFLVLACVILYFLFDKCLCSLIIFSISSLCLD